MQTRSSLVLNHFALEASHFFLHGMMSIVPLRELRHVRFCFQYCALQIENFPVLDITVCKQWLLTLPTNLTVYGL